MLPTRDPRASDPCPAGTGGFVSVEAIDSRIVVLAPSLCRPHRLMIARVALRCFVYNLAAIVYSGAQFGGRSLDRRSP